MALGRWTSLLAAAVAIFGCAGDDGAAGVDDTTGAAASTSEGSTGPALTSSTGEAMPDSSGDDSDGSSGSGGLPTYGDSPCWGEPRQTVIYNGRTHQTATVDATCRAEGERTLVYVQDELWDQGLNQDLIDSFMHRFELFTPEGSVNPEQGVITNNEEIFGALVPEATPGGKVAVYIIDSEGGGDGYLCGWCDTPQIHLDGVVLQPIDADFPVSIAAHESYHIIHRGYDQNETTWVDESLAEASMTANGFFTDLDWLASFMADPDQNWGPGDPELGDFNYGGALLWGSFLWERGGPELMAAITSEPTDGWEGLDAALNTVGDDKSAFDLYLDLMVAIYLDAPELGYGFASFDPGQVSRQVDLSSGSMHSGGLAPYGMDFYPLTSEGELTITVTATGTGNVFGVAAAAGDAVDVVRLDGATTLMVNAGDDAFIALTADAGTTYDLTVQ